MKTGNCFSTYFKAVPTLSHYQENSCKQNAISLLCLLSYLTFVIPVGMAIGYGISLCGRAHALENPPMKDSADRVDKAAKAPARSTETGNQGQTLDPNKSHKSHQADPSHQNTASSTVFEIIETPESTVVRDYLGDLTVDEKKERGLFLSSHSEFEMQINTKYTTQVFLRRVDIFESGAPVIVNAANTHLGGGGGIDGAIHKKGGTEYEQAHRALKTHYHSKYVEGYASMIGSGALKDKFGIQHVIVVAGPRGPNSNSQKESQLYSCYYNSLVLAQAQGYPHVAFPSISTGEFHYPKDRGAAISIKAISDFLEANPDTCVQEISIHFYPTNTNAFDPYKAEFKKPI